MRGVTGAMIDRHGIEALMDAQGLAPATIRQRLRVYDALTRDGRPLDELES